MSHNKDQFQSIVDFSLSYLTESNKEIYKTLLNSVHYIYGSDVQGDIAEFGTMTGRTAVCLATGHREMEGALSPFPPRAAKKLWFFDSFEGLQEIKSKVDIESPHVKNKIWTKGGCQGLSSEQFNDLISQISLPNSFKVVEGWFENTVKTLNDEKFAMVHIDCDLYESTIHVLENFFAKKRITPGCIILFDDWNCNFASNSFGERKAWQEMVEKYKIDYSDCGDYAIASKKLIVHTYKGMDQ